MGLRLSIGQGKAVSRDRNRGTHAPASLCFRSPCLGIAMVLLVVLLIGSGGGTEMTPLLLVMLALPWSGLFGAVQAGGGSAFIDREVPGLLINAGLLFAVGLWIDSKLPPRDTA